VNTTVLVLKSVGLRASGALMSFFLWTWPHCCVVFAFLVGKTPVFSLA
jgi:hypothetical protein